MLEPGEKETIKLNAPDEPGDYEYVCTYPEHWKVMYGRLIVVRDLDAYLESAANAPVDAPRPASGDPAHEH
jgi:hypothetical protein